MADGSSGAPAAVAAEEELPKSPLPEERKASDEETTVLPEPKEASVEQIPGSPECEELTVSTPPESEVPTKAGGAADSTAAEDKDGPALVVTPSLPRAGSGLSDAGTAVQTKARKRDAFFKATQISSVVHGDAWRRLNAELGEIPAIMVVAQSFQTTPIAVAAGGILGSLAFLLFGLGGQLVCTAFGVIYPAFESFKAVEEFANLQDPSEVYVKAAGMQFWLTYWVVAAAVTSLEYVFYYILVWIPFYYPFKLFALLWFYLPASRGANHVYHWCVAPSLRRNRGRIDATIVESSRKLQESGARLRRGATQKALAGASQALWTGASGVAMLKNGLVRRRAQTEPVAQDSPTARS
mmetsp:Transcript_9349/g.17745  ORF Transcript_9349/g.17745 Transcript_9349/m.17745 type:complete len:353 (-) Transcript_9349:163-1221(-)